MNRISRIKKGQHTKIDEILYAYRQIIYKDEFEVYEIYQVV